LDFSAIEEEEEEGGGERNKFLLQTWMCLRVIGRHINISRFSCMPLSIKFRNVYISNNKPIGMLCNLHCCNFALLHCLLAEPNLLSA